MFEHLKAVPSPGFEYVAPVLSTADAHDAKIAARNAWINDPRVASYFWAVTRDGKPVVQEYDACDDGECAKESATAHRNHFADIPGKWKPVDGLPAFEATEDFAPFTLHAVPVTLDHQDLKPLEADIKPGTIIVYQHRPSTNVVTGGTHYSESFLFGRILEDKTVGIVQVYSNGDTFEHASVDEALHHAHPSQFDPAHVAPEPEVVAKG